MLEISRWGLLWPAFTLAALYLLWRGGARERCLAASTGLAVTAYCAIFLETNWPLELHVEQADAAPPLANRARGDPRRDVRGRARCRPGQVLAALRPPRPPRARRVTRAAAPLDARLVTVTLSNTEGEHLDEHARRITDFRRLNGPGDPLASVRRPRSAGAGRKWAANFSASVSSGRRPMTQRSSSEDFDRPAAEGRPWGDLLAVETVREMHAWLDNPWIQAQDDSRGFIHGGPWRDQVVQHPGWPRE